MSHRAIDTPLQERIEHIVTNGRGYTPEPIIPRAYEREILLTAKPADNPGNRVAVWTQAGNIAPHTSEMYFDMLSRTPLGRGT